MKFTMNLTLVVLYNIVNMWTFTNIRTTDLAFFLQKTLERTLKEIAAVF